MLNFSSKKSTIINILMAVILLITIINSVYLHIKNQNLKDEDTRQIHYEWYAVHDMFKIVDKYINSGSKNGEKYTLYVNSVCHHFGSVVSASKMNVNMHNLLILSYDPLFSNLAKPEETLNKEEAIELLTKMNSDLLAISKEFVDVNNKPEDSDLYDQSTSQYSKINAKVEEVSNKYQKLVDDYFKKYKK